jgi:hypothetical protein
MSSAVHLPIGGTTPTLGPSRPPTSGGPVTARTSPVASRPKALLTKSVSSGGHPTLPAAATSTIVVVGHGHARGLPTPPPTPPQGHAPFIPGGGHFGTPGGMPLLLDGGSLRMDESLRLPLWALLRHPRAIAQLSAFVRREHSEENLEFVQEVERFRQLALRLDAIDPKWESKWDAQYGDRYIMNHTNNNNINNNQQNHQTNGRYDDDEKRPLPSNTSNGLTSAGLAGYGTGSERKRRSSIHTASGLANGKIGSPVNGHTAHATDRHDTEHKQQLPQHQQHPLVPPLPLMSSGSSGSLLHHNNNNNQNNNSGNVTAHGGEDTSPRPTRLNNQNESPTNHAAASSTQPAGNNNNNDGTTPIRRERIRLRAERHQRGDSRNGSPNNLPPPLTASNSGGTNTDPLPSNDSPSSPSTPDEVRGARSSSHSQKFPRKLLPPLAHLSRNETRMSVDAAAISQLKAQHQAVMMEISNAGGTVTSSNTSMSGATTTSSTTAPTSAMVNSNNNNARRGQSGPFRFPHPISAFSQSSMNATGGNHGATSNTANNTLNAATPTGHHGNASLISNTPSPLMAPFIVPVSTSTDPNVSSSTISSTSTLPPDLSLTPVCDPNNTLPPPHMITSISVSATFSGASIATTHPPQLSRTGSTGGISHGGSPGNNNLRNTMTSLDVIHERARSNSLDAPSPAAAATSATTTVSTPASLSSSPAIAAAPASVIVNYNTPLPLHATVNASVPPPSSLVSSISSPVGPLVRYASTKHLSGGNTSTTPPHTSIATHAHFPAPSTTPTNGVINSSVPAPSSSSLSSSILPPPSSVVVVPPLYTAMNGSASSSLSVSTPLSSSTSAAVTNPARASFVPHYIGGNQHGPAPPTPPNPLSSSAVTALPSNVRSSSSLSRRRLFSPPSPANAIQGVLGGTFVSTNPPPHSTVTFSSNLTGGAISSSAVAAAAAASNSRHGSVGLGSRPHTPILTLPALVPPLLPALAPMSLVNPLTSRLPIGTSISPSFAALPGSQFTFGSASNTMKDSKTNANNTSSNNNHTPRLKADEEIVLTSIADEATRIWSKFCPEAPMAISWPMSTIRRYRYQLTNCGRVESPFVFNDAQQQELESLNNDILPRFYQSKEYKVLTSDLLTELAVKINSFERWHTGNEIPITAQVETTPPTSPLPSGGSSALNTPRFPVAVTRLPLASSSTIPHQVHTPITTPAFGPMSSESANRTHGLPTISITAPTPPPARPLPPSSLAHLYGSGLAISLPPLAPLSPDPPSSNMLYSPPQGLRNLLPVDTDLASTSSLIGNSPLAAVVDAHNATSKYNNNNNNNGQQSPQHLLLSTSSVVDPLSSIYNAATAAALLSSPNPNLPGMTIASSAVNTPATTNHLYDTPMSNNQNSGFATARGTMHISTTPSAASVNERSSQMDENSPSAATIAANLLSTPLGSPAAAHVSATATAATATVATSSIATSTRTPSGAVVAHHHHPTINTSAMTPSAANALITPHTTHTTISATPPLPSIPSPLQHHDTISGGAPLPSPPSLSESRHNSDSGSAVTESDLKDEHKDLVVPTMTTIAMSHGGDTLGTSGNIPTLGITTSVSMGVSHSGSHSHTNPPSPPTVTTQHHQHHPHINNGSGSGRGHGPHGGSTTPTPPPRTIAPLGIAAAHGSLRRQHSHSHLGAAGTMGTDNQGRPTYFFPTDTYDPPSRLAKSQTDTSAMTTTITASTTTWTGTGTNAARLSGFLAHGETKTATTSMAPPSTLPYTSSLSLGRLHHNNAAHTTPAMSSGLATVAASSTFLVTGVQSPSQNSPVTPVATTVPAPSMFVFRRTKNEDADRLKFSFHAFFDNPLGLQAVGAFMKAEYSVDNLDFVIAVDDFKQRVLDKDEMGRVCMILVVLSCLLSCSLIVSFVF